MARHRNFHNLDYNEGDPVQCLYYQSMMLCSIVSTCHVIIEWLLFQSMAMMMCMVDHWRRRLPYHRAQPVGVIVSTYCVHSYMKSMVAMVVHSLALEN